MLDYSTLTDAELSEHLAAAYTEERRRQVIANAEAAGEKLANDWAEAVGRKAGDEWAQPQGAHDAYLKDAEVTHEGKTWVSLTPNNVWEPGVSGWREKAVEPTPDNPNPAPPEYKAPTGAHDAYSKGSRVTFQGKVYKSTIDNNTWSPIEYPAGWELVS